MNEIINKTKTNIEVLNQRFFFILENFVPIYIKSLQNPQDTDVAKEMSHINTVINLGSIYIIIRFNRYNNCRENIPWISIT